MKQIKEVLEGVYSNLELRKSIVPLFISNPGMGKTRLIEEFAKEKNVKLIEIITSQVSPFEVSGICVPSHNKEKMVYYDFDRIEDLKDGDILFFDELLAGNPITLSACLTLIEQRRTISGKNLPAIMIIAAANPQNQAPLPPAVKERFIYYDVKFDKDMWIDYMVKKYQITKTIGNKLSDLIKNEKFTGTNFYTPRSVDKAVNMIINTVPTPYHDVVSLILNEYVTNNLDQPIKLTETMELAPSEKISWLELIRLKNKIPVKLLKEPRKKKSNDFVLPKQWFIEINLKDFNEIYEGYFKNLETSWSRCSGFGLSDNKVQTNYWKSSKDLIPKEYKEITLEQFREHVLNK